MIIQSKNQHHELIRLALSIEGGLLLLAIMLAWVFNIPVLASLHVNGPDMAIGIVSTSPLLVMLIWIMQKPVGPLRDIKTLLETKVVPLVRSCTIFDFAWISLLAGLGEEILFRGVMQMGLYKVTSPVIAIIISGVIFGLAHCITIVYATIAGFIGVYFGIVFLYTGNLLSVITAHAVYDFIALVYLVKLRSRSVNIQRNL